MFAKVYAKLEGFDITFNASSMQPDEMSTINSLIRISKPKSKWMLCFLNFFSSSTLVCSRVSSLFLSVFNHYSSDQSSEETI